jgi:hypothetical protein
MRRVRVPKVRAGARGAGIAALQRVLIVLIVVGGGLRLNLVVTCSAIRVAT